MICQHTWKKVLSGDKRQTSRIWKDNYDISGWRDDGSPKLKALEISNVNTATLGNTRKLYYLGQALCVQPARGQKGIAKIRVLELAKRDVRDFTQADIQREGFGDGSLAEYESFLSLWVSMHDKWLWRQVANKTHVNFTAATDGRIAQFYTALVIRFELVAESKTNDKPMAE